MANRQFDPIWPPHDTVPASGARSEPVDGLYSTASAARSYRLRGLRFLPL